MSRYIKPSAFHSFDPLRIDPLELIEPIQSSLGGDHHQLKELVKNSPDISAFKQGVPPIFDPATILFLSCLDLPDDGETPEPIEKGLTRDRLGRFPIEGGNAIEYIIASTIDNSEEKIFHDLLIKLSEGLDENNLGEAGFTNTMSGMVLCGWLTKEEVIELRDSIQRQDWSINADELIDGGVLDAVRHLIVMLRGAEKRQCGLLKRIYG